MYKNDKVLKATEHKKPPINPSHVLYGGTLIYIVSLIQIKINISRIGNGLYESPE